MSYFFNILSGVFAGVFGGMGMGGGTVLIPILTIFLGFEQKLAQGINLMSFLLMALFSIFVHTKNGYIRTKNILYVIIPGVIFAFIGSLSMSVLPSKILKILFGIFLCVLAVIEFVKVLKK